MAFDTVFPLLPTLTARVLSPGIVLLSALSLLIIRSQPPSSPSPITPVVVATSIPRRALILTFLSLISLTYLFDGLAFVVIAVLDNDWPRHSGIPINTVTGVVAFSGLAALGAWKDIHGLPVWSLKRVKVAITASLAFDITLAVLLAFRLRHGQTPPVFSIRTLVHVLFPAFRIVLLLPLLVGLLSPRVIYSSVGSFDDVESPEPTTSTFLLPPGIGSQPSAGLSGVSAINGEGSKYGTFRTTRSNLQTSTPVTRAATPSPSTAPTDAKANLKPEISLEPSWGELWVRIRRLGPYLWPKNDRWLQFLGALCLIILLLGRVINLAMPLTIGKLVSVLEGTSAGSPWPYLFGYAGLRFLQGSGGLSALQDCLWAPVMQYSDREMSQLSFDHLLNLSYSWHTKRKTGEVLRVLDRGAAINHTLELLLFSVLPTFMDIAIALIAFWVLFSWTLSLVIFIVMFAYVAASVILTQWRTRLRRQMNERDIATRGIHTDCLLNYETVKYFGGEEHEGERYREAIREYQALEYKVIISLNLLNLTQAFIITAGLLVGSLMVARQVVFDGQHKGSEFVKFITYLAQLYGPLNQLGRIYRSINQSLVDTEKLLALLSEPTEVNDKENAADLVVHSGEIEFDDVHFSYDDGRTTAINGVSFKVPKGSSVALVGESGSGKSTILRLLYRFYDLGEGQGRILIDGQDIRDITQKSLRKAIGVVPQDSVLFNSSIQYNIGYGKFGSTPEEIEAAAKSAQMHERIMGFPDGYNTKVGERGVRLSGGEKQRVSIARTLLKNPPILLLDEATSALDTSTEKDIQKALQNLVQGRSSLSIAHRLSTIASADIILVLKDGQIYEQGSFRELVELNGLFASMWANQVSSSEGPAPSIAEASIKHEVSGYAVDTAEVQEIQDAQPEEIAVQPTEPVSEAIEYTPSVRAEPVDIDEEAAPVEPLITEPQPFPASADTPDVPAEAPAAQEPTIEEALIHSPTPLSSPIAFPTSSDSQSEIHRVETPASGAPAQVAMPLPMPAPGPAVTFGASVNSPPSRTGTPDPESEPKRKRISSQNFQRLARRISLTTRRTGSSSMIPSISGLPGFKREQSPRVSSDDAATRGEGSNAGASNDSPAGSITGAGDDSKGKLKKKDKKDKNRKGTL
ncbi:hypothetical protein HYPSUDRAFT_130746 [Hypholoma sublateritium FD-334 SS-4]|uniref:Uncharacterized protein n=1 Tax=Hypholoma sublateritium (strain FD-334 SS-4) TaxID=945553 RepID=A0A0D2PA34_HYPSF|nr:hypothetical protein HYPSUDRAFT_130746 [Hypholoma sublateritium FD-334 SS-4]